MQQLDNNGPRFWGTWLPTKPDMSEGVTLLARDPPGHCVGFYGQDGQLISTSARG